MLIEDAKRLSERWQPIRGPWQGELQGVMRGQS